MKTNLLAGTRPCLVNSPLPLSSHGTKGNQAGIETIYVFMNSALLKKFTH